MRKILPTDNFWFGERARMRLPVGGKARFLSMALLLVSVSFSCTYGGTYIREVRNTKLERKNTAILHYNKGVEAFYEKKYQEAITNYSNAVKTDAELIEAYLNIGLIYDEFMKDKQKALQYYRLYIRKGGTEPAVRSLIRAVEERHR